MTAWAGRRHGAGGSPSTDTGDLVSYLVVRFVVVLVCVMVVESVVVWVESALLMPALQGALDDSQLVAMDETTSVLSLLRRMLMLLVAMAQGGLLRMAGLARGSLVVLLLIVMLVLLLLPALLGALVFSRMVVSRVRELQERRERELLRIDQQRSQFMTDVAHDLRTPLMAISGMAHAISDGVVRDDAMRDEYLRSICDKADTMGGLVSSVFDYTKLGSAAFELEFEPVDLPQLLLQEAAVAYTDIEDAAMHLSVLVPEERCTVRADRVQLARVVANLLANAVRHNPAGTEVALMLVREAGIAHVIVADTGVRIEGDPDDLFQPFSRGDAARTTSGSGLGLSICKRVADLHGYGLSLVQPYGRFGKAFVLRCTVVD